MLNKKFWSIMKKIGKVTIAIALAGILTLSYTDSAEARSGGRIGGGSFRRSAPSRSYNAPTRSAPGGYYPGGGGGGFFLLPFMFGGGGGGIITLLAIIVIANILSNAFKGASNGGAAGYTEYDANPNVTITKLQVGLLAQARNLQADLDRMAATADTGTAAGRAQVLQEATLALLRHPEYWAYGQSETAQAGLNAAEAKFNQWTLAERSKFTEETLTNYNDQKHTSQTKKLPTDSLSNPAETGEYILITLVVGTTKLLKLPLVNSTADFKQALTQVGSIASDQLLAVEILWTPQAEGDVLTADELLENYPNLKLL
jgi:uncharacterized membrane protein